MAIPSIQPSAQWLATWQANKVNTQPPLDIQKIFSSEKIGEKKLHLMELGTLNFPTGKILVCDPLCELNADNEYLAPYLQSIPAGRHSLQVLVAEYSFDERYAFCRLKCSEQQAVR
ncbi:hypothetical protein A6A20_04770 [Volucribacter amazonae]|uniref:Uncharacterized protein n=1 Tax=Volucribacter amazonae TaxID=256731 RepID=A0A9X4PC56_9PAST|nr:hypothetical protein [Volucribacter amazonae]